MHAPVAVQYRWLCQVLRGHYAYYGRRSNFRSLNAFYQGVRRLWFRALGRRNQRRMTWQGFAASLVRLPLPAPRITHPRPAPAR